MDVNTVLDINSIICALVPSLCTVIAAVWAAHIAKKAVKEDITPMFQSYSDKSYDFSNVIGKAEHNIVIIAASGYSFLNDHGATIEKKLRRGISVYYLFLNKKRFVEMQEYMHGKEGKKGCIKSIYSPVEDKLKELKLEKKYSEKLQCRIFPRIMTASYIGVDIPFGEQENSFFLHSEIQVIQYQYRRGARVSPMTCFSPDKNREHFLETVDSMRAMWDASTERQFDSADPIKEAKQSCALKE